MGITRSHPDHDGGLRKDHLAVNGSIDNAPSNASPYQKCRIEETTVLGLLRRAGVQKSSSVAFRFFLLFSQDDFHDMELSLYYFRCKLQSCHDKVNRTSRSDFCC